MSPQACLCLHPEGDRLQRWHSGQYFIASCHLTVTDWNAYLIYVSSFCYIILTFFLFFISISNKLYSYFLFKKRIYIISYNFIFLTFSSLFYLNFLFYFFIVFSMLIFFLWFGDKASWSRYLGWLVCWFQHKFQNKRSLSKQPSLWLLDSLLIIVMHHAWSNKVDLKN